MQRDRLASKARLGGIVGLGMCLAAVGAGNAHAQLYKCVEEGVTVYSDAPCTSLPGSSPDQSGAVSREQVLSLMAAIDKAAARRDWNAVADFYADDAVIEIEIRSPKWPSRNTVGREEYRRMLKDAWEKIRDYSWQREHVEIAVIPETRRAELRNVLIERWLDPGGAMMARSEQVALVELRGGKPKFILLRAVGGGPKPQR